MTTTPGIDGRQEIALLPGDGCCPPSICQIDPCGLVCSFVAALPRGPLWDRDKQMVLAANAECGSPGSDPPSDSTSACGSVVAHAAYAARRLYILLTEVLWPALCESRPETAYDTLDQWLDRLGWADCFKCACTCVDDASELPPFQVLQANGQTICCPSEAPDGLTAAVKKGVVLALWRLRLGIIRNVDAINFVISSLGAVVTTSVADDGVPVVTVCAASDTLPAAARATCAPADPGTVQAYWTLTCDGAGDNRRIYPGVLAAQCIVIAMFAGRRVRVTRCA